MEKEFKNIDDLLRKCLNDFEKKPSEGVWKGISSALPGKGLLVFFPLKFFGLFWAFWYLYNDLLFQLRL